MRAKAMGRAELERVRNALLLSLPGQFDTNAAIADGYARVWALGLPQMITLSACRARWRAVTARSAWKAARGPPGPQPADRRGGGGQGQSGAATRGLGTQADASLERRGPAQTLSRRASVPYRPAASRNALARSVRSQVNSGSSRPKWP